MGDQPVPVLVVAVTEEEADKMLLTLDPLAAMAHTDEQQLLALLDETTFNAQSIEDMLETLVNTERELMPDWSYMGTASQEKIDRRTVELQNRFTDAKRPEMIDLICPSCTTEFQIRRDTLDQGFGRDS